MRYLIFIFVFVFMAVNVSADVIYFNDSFNRANSNTIGGAWTTETDTSNWIKITSSEMVITDTSAVSGLLEKTGLTDVSTSLSDVILEFDVNAVSSNNNGCFIDLKDDGNILARVFFDVDEDLRSYTGSPGSTTSAEILTLTSGTTYHVEMTDFDFTNHNFDVFVDGTEYNNSENHWSFYATDVDGFDEIEINSGGSTQITCEIDNIKYYKVEVSTTTPTFIGVSDGNPFGIANVCNIMGVAGC